MRKNVAGFVKKGRQISYDDGRPGHRGIRATVIEVVVGHGMLVQFDDRADMSYILFSDSGWMNFMSVVV